MVSKSVVKSKGWPLLPLAEKGLEKDLLQKIKKVISKSRIKKRVLLKNVKHDAGFPTFQKKNLHIKPCIGNNVL